MGPMIPKETTYNRYYGKVRNVHHFGNSVFSIAMVSAAGEGGGRIDFLLGPKTGPT